MGLTTILTTIWVCPPKCAKVQNPYFLRKIGRRWASLDTLPMSGGQGVASSNLASPTKAIHFIRPSRTCIQPTFLPPLMTPSGFQKTELVRTRSGHGSKHTLGMPEYGVPISRWCAGSQPGSLPPHCPADGDDQCYHLPGHGRHSGWDGAAPVRYEPSVAALVPSQIR